MALVAFSRQIGETVVVASAELRQRVLDGLDAHQDLVVFAQTGRAAERAATAATALASAKRRLGLLGAAANAIAQMLTGAATILVLISGISTLSAGRLDGPLLAGVLLAVIASFEAAAPLVRGATRLSAAAAAAERLKAMAEIESPIVEPRAPAELPSGGSLELDHVRFGFDPSRPVLDDLSLSIATGERVAIVGPSGAGKSTIAQLLVRLADPQSGAIRLNGVELSRLPLAALREHISLMTQEAPIFNDTIRNNLLIGSPHASTEALRQAIEAVELDDFVRKLPEGLDAVVGEAGATLSTGQARRLALARTLLSPAQILVLDEPTSGLDRATELTFFGNLRQATAGRTVVLITHASLPDGVVDRIYPLNGGALRSM
jgi:ATP-binding cassette subfamily C protein CydC